MILNFKMNSGLQCKILVHYQSQKMDSYMASNQAWISSPKNQFKIWVDTTYSFEMKQKIGIKLCFKELFKKSMLLFHRRLSTVSGSVKNGMIKYD